jgi:uncharacterized membrane protein/glutaredoxin
VATTSRKTKTRQTTRTRPETPPLRSGPNYPLLAIGALGVALTGYLTWAALSGGQVQGCAAGGGCDVVLSSRWATLLGLPTALWGLFGYAALAAVAFVRRADTQWSYAWTITFFGVCYSVYLTAVSLTILGSACPYCLTSLALMTAALVLVVRQRPPALAHRSWAWSAGGRGALAAVVILLLHANYVAPQAESLGPEDPLIRALAEHLSDQDVVFYGASWCPHCQEQKRLFGASAERLPYVECSLGGNPNAPQSAACRTAGIQTYPTWIINGRPIVGQVMTLAQLADATAFPDAAKFK